MRVRVRHRSSFSSTELNELRTWLEVAYDDGPWRAEHWAEIGPGPHVVAEDDDGAMLAHACVAWVPVTIGGATLRAGYLQDGATPAHLPRPGHRTAVGSAPPPPIHAQAQNGVLPTRAPP